MRAIAVFFSFLASLILVAPANAQQKLLHQERSLYRNIFVTQDGDERCMLFRYPRPYGRESCRLLHEPNRGSVMALNMTSSKVVPKSTVGSVVSADAMRMPHSFTTEGL